VKLLLLLDLNHYRNEFLDEENLQDEWEAAMTNPGKYINLLVGQCDDKDQRAETDEENYYNSLPWDQKTKNFLTGFDPSRASS
jgi:hypothetical protein